MLRPSGSHPASAAASTEVSDSDRKLLAAIIYCEAGNQSMQGKIAVGNVVLNRVNSRKFPNTISKVIYQKGQFTPAGSGWLKKVLNGGKIPQSCYEAADRALAGERPVGGAVFFMRTYLHSHGSEGRLRSEGKLRGPSLYGILFLVTQADGLQISAAAWQPGEERGPWHSRYF